MSPRSKWGSLLAGVPKSGPPESNVVHLLDPEWAELAHEIKQAMNQRVHWEAEAHRVEIGYNSAIDRLRIAQERWAEKNLELEAKVEFPRTANHLERDA